MPAKPHSEMPNVYKSSVFGLNFNTVTASSTMFARRVFELMSSNTLVVSNFSRGTFEMFGDLIIYPDREPERLGSLSDADIEDLRARALAKVLDEHTYTHRWLSILSHIGLSAAPRENSLTFVYRVSSREQALQAIQHYQNQGLAMGGGKLLLVATQDVPDLEVANLYKDFNRHGACVTSYHHATRYAISDKYRPVETTHFVEAHLGASLCPQRLRQAMRHLQYLPDLPLAVDSHSKNRNQVAKLPPQATAIRPAMDFLPWVRHAGAEETAYHI